ncbi:unnamed protein product [Caenorhabditis auriculariae]|uniref:Cytosol aminopeptidase domain-containing protein n=1 Tax=Caenorhabditis auriculariae TaxID=2777116 RepID=A0A8S1GRY4_9PELO|nr:unnamed protein product [Caenorhabditis auriculariae]
MAHSLVVRAGVQRLAADGSTAVVLVGQRRHLAPLTYDGPLKDALQTFVRDEEHWKTAISRLPKTSGRIPLHFDLAHVVTVPDTASRYNSPSNSVSVFKEVKSIAFPEDVKNIHFVLYAEYSHVLSSVAAVARCFPKFSLKTAKKNVENIHIDVVVPGGPNLKEKDTKFLNDLCEAIRETGRLIDIPANILTTDKLVDEAVSVGKSLGAKIHIVRGDELLQQGFGGIYHVGKAALTPPAFVVLSKEVSGSDESYALVGKGVVYDTGGMQIKGKTGMPNMKRDMGGAAGMLHAFSTLVRNGFNKTLHACLCIVENNISPVANKPDDIITMLSGKSVEINNTDAEGRLILADGVFYAKETLKATTIIDMATLTGAQSYLSGKLHAAAMTNDEELENNILTAGRASGDLVAPMIFAPDLYSADLKSPVADMRNSNLGKMDGPPSAVAGLFIGAHIKYGQGIRWLHLDIAAPAEHADRGTGFGPALFSSLLGNHTDVPLLRH